MSALVFLLSFALATAQVSVNPATWSCPYNCPPDVELLPAQLPGDSLESGAAIDFLLMQLNRAVYLDTFTPLVGETTTCLDLEMLASLNMNDVRVMLYAIPSRNALAIVLRGTVFSKLSNVAADIDMLQTACSFHGVSCGSFHKGIYELYGSFAAQLRATVLSHANSKSYSNIYVTGHSLGGSLATLAAFDYATFSHTRTPTAGPFTRIHLMTIGAPRPGNAAFAETFASYMTPGAKSVFVSGRRYQTRTATNVDVIPTVPTRCLGFVHMFSVTALDCPASVCQDINPASLHVTDAYVESMMAFGHVMATCASNQAA